MRMPFSTSQKNGKETTCSRASSRDRSTRRIGRCWWEGQTGIVEQGVEKREGKSDE